MASASSGDMGEPEFTDSNMSPRVCPLAHSMSGTIVFFNDAKKMTSNTGARSELNEQAS